MISETSFSHHYTSTWKSLAPTTDLFIRRVNGHLFKREARPLTSTAAPSRRALLNETAFALFVQRGKIGADNSSKIGEIELRQAVTEASAFIARVDHADGLQEAILLDAEKKEVVEQTERLQSFFTTRSPDKPVTYHPKFTGCGIIDSCNGDVLVGSTLYEVKAGDRYFRSPDLRQLLVYAALDYEAHAGRFDTVGLFNPRVGLSVELSLEALSLEVSGRPSFDLLADIIRVISSGDISR